MNSRFAERRTELLGFVSPTVDYQVRRLCSKRWHEDRRAEDASARVAQVTLDIHAPAGRGLPSYRRSTMSGASIW